MSYLITAKRNPVHFCGNMSEIVLMKFVLLYTRGGILALPVYLIIEKINN